MEFIKPDTNINFIGVRKYAYLISCTLIVIGIISLYARGLNYGIDFAGGTLVQVRFHDNVKTQDVRNALKPFGFNNTRIQSYGNPSDHGFLIRIPVSEGTPQELSKILRSSLYKAFGKNKVDIRRVEMVGAGVSKDLKEKGFLSLFYAGIGILIYVWWRFELTFSLGAILALIHDVLITIGVFSITYKEINLPIVAALLTIIGYSLNDTIVVFDRIRENMKKQNARSKLFDDLVNQSINQTISRTLLTSFTTFIVVLCLFIFGGGVIHNFSFAMMVGIIVGTYSSIYIASPVVLFLSSEGKRKKR